MLRSVRYYKRVLCYKFDSNPQVLNRDRLQRNYSVLLIYHCNTSSTSRYSQMFSGVVNNNILIPIFLHVPAPYFFGGCGSCLRREMRLFGGVGDHISALVVSIEQEIGPEGVQPVKHNEHQVDDRNHRGNHFKHVKQRLLEVVDPELVP
jgi:hypothetical protein